MVNNKTKKIFSLLLSFVIIITLFSGCSNAGSKGEKASEKVTVKDMANNDVTIPSKIDKVAITHWGEVLNIFLSLGEIDKVAAMSDTSRYPWVRKVYPKLKEVPDYGSFEDVNPEELMKLDADIIFTPVGAPKSNKKMQELGMPVYVTKVEDTYEYYKKELLAIAKLLGKTEKAEEIIKYQEDMLKMVKDRVKDIPENKRKKVYVMRRDILQKHNGDWMSSEAVVNAGGINVAGKTDKAFDTNVESLVGWDPEVIIQVIHVENNNEYYNVLKNDAKFKDITAIKNGDVYQFPVGLNYWYSGAEMGIGTLLVGKLLYPERFEDIDLKKEVKDFYKKLCDLDITDEDYNELLNNFKGAKPMNNR